jgi:hypothetical protein
MERAVGRAPLVGETAYTWTIRASGFSTARLERALPSQAPEPSVGTRVIFGIWAYMHTLTGQSAK